MSSSRVESSDWPFISVVLPVRNEETFVSQILRQLLRQKYPEERYEIIVVDGISTDGTKEQALQIADRSPRVRVFDNPARTSAAGRNIGFRTGSGEVFLIVDGHCYLNNDRLLEHTARCLRESGAFILGRPQPLDPPGLTTFQRAVAVARTSWLGHSPKSHIYSTKKGFVSPTTVAATYRREVFEKVGYVDESFDACEDVEFNYRLQKAGLSCYFHPDLAVKYYPRETFGALLRQMIRYGRGRADLVGKHYNAAAAEYVVPLLVLLLAVGVILVPFVSNPIKVAWAAAAGLYVLVLFVNSVALATRHELRPLLLLSVFVGIHFGLGLGLVMGLCCPPKSRRTVELTPSTRRR